MSANSSTGVARTAWAPLPSSSPCNPKVGNFHDAVVIHQQICGLEVPVDDLALVQVVHALAHLVGDLERL